MSNIDSRLYNPLGQVFGEMPPEVQAEMKRLATEENIECRDRTHWQRVIPTWTEYYAYRIRPGWAPPELAGGLIEILPFVDCGAWVITSPINNRVGGLEQGPIIIGFRGYRYGADPLTMWLKFTKAHGGWKLIIPDAVVFDKAEVEAAK